MFRSTNLGAIIGGAAAAVIVLVLGAVLVWYLMKRRRTSQRGALPLAWSEDNDAPPPRFLPATGSNLVPTAPSSTRAVLHGSSVPKAPHRPRVKEKSSREMSPHSGHGTTAHGTPPRRSYTHVVATRVQAEIPDEPVEGGVLSRQTSMRSILPPYSPGGFPG